MTKIIRAFENQDQLSADKYYATLYNKIPSTIDLVIHQDNAEDYRAEVSKIILSTSKSMELIAKSYKMENKGEEKNSPLQLLFKDSDECKHSLVVLSINKNSFSILFLFDTKDAETENTFLETSKALRERFKLKEKAVFQILMRIEGQFHSKPIPIESEPIALENIYRDDFQEVHKTIMGAFNKKGAGILLLHGLPGTGKTSYIRHLITTFPKQNFLLIQEYFVRYLLEPFFIDYITQNPETILIIEDAEKALASREDSRGNSLSSMILQFTDGLFSMFLQTKIIFTFNTNINNIDKALIRKGRLIASYEFKSLDLEKTNSLLADLGHPPADTELTLAEIFNYEQKEFSKRELSTIGFSKF